MYQDDEMTIKVNVGELIEKIEKNRKAHIDQWQAAIQAYRNRLYDILNDMMSRLNNGEAVRPHIDLRKPEDHVKDYDNVIEMLGMSQEENMELSYSQFKKFVKDEWDWSNGFHVLNSSLTGSPVSNKK
jgi:hypothetical protein